MELEQKGTLKQWSFKYVLRCRGNDTHNEKKIEDI